MRTLAVMVVLSVCLLSSLSRAIFGQSNSSVLEGIAIRSLSQSVVAQSPVDEDVKHDTQDRVIRQDQSIHIDVGVVLVNVTVTDRKDRPITNLEAWNFRIFENNVEQEIEYFSSEDVPISVGVILDLSGSMAGKVEKSKEAVLQFLRTANLQDEFFLVSFSDRAELTSAFTTSVADLQSRLLFASARGNTALLDAIYLGLSEMRTARNAKRALLIVSDGGDNHSRYRIKDIYRLAEEADAQLYAVGMFDPLENPSRSPEEQNGPSLLSEITELTGGRAFDVTNVNQLPDMAMKIGTELRNQYVVGYRPRINAHDAKWHKIQIKVSAPKALRPLHVFARNGYYASSR